MGVGCPCELYLKNLFLAQYYLIDDDDDDDAADDDDELFFVGFLTDERRIALFLVNSNQLNQLN